MTFIYLLSLDICRDLHINADKYDYVEISPRMDGNPLEGSKQTVVIRERKPVNISLHAPSRFLRVGFHVQGAKSVKLQFIGETENMGIVSLYL